MNSRSPSLGLRVNPRTVLRRDSHASLRSVYHRGANPTHTEPPDRHRRGGTADRAPNGQHDLTLHVEYAERGNEYGILFIFSLYCENRHLEYVRIHVIYRVTQAGYIIRIRMAASPEYVDTYSTGRVNPGSRDGARIHWWQGRSFCGG